MKPKVLFLCTGNSARSQMAEGFLRHIAGHKYEVLSAGIEPKGLNPLAVQAMLEAGIDISNQRSTDVRELLGTPIQFVVTVCSSAKEKCPVFPGTVKFLHWGLDDPAAAAGASEEKLAIFRRVRDEILAHIEREFGDPGLPAGAKNAPLPNSAKN
jgi:arsenate reductase (thioredoxin)